LTGNDLNTAAEVLRNGGLVGIPTETVYGLAANGLNPEAVISIFKAKNRPHFDPLILHFPHVEAVKRCVLSFPEKAQQLTERFWPGPLTLVLPKNPIVPDVVSSGLDSVAVRIPRHPLTLELLQQLDFPLAAPSANPFGYISPTKAKHVEDQLADRVDYVLDGGDCSVGVESTIVSFETPTPTVLRLGGLSLEDIESCIGPVEQTLITSNKPTAPGMLESHYAPNHKLTLVDNMETFLRSYTLIDTCGIISFSKTFTSPEIALNIVLSPEGSVDEAAEKLFSALREMDTSVVSEIIAERVPDVGIGRAVNDRLQRAAAPKMNL
jgi:L-threonylcarbamoyladenylate synthase